MALQTAHPDQLQLGVYVSLAQDWMDHPFMFSAFKIRTAEQLAEIQALGLASIQWDPARSDMPVLPPAPAHAPRPIQSSTNAFVIDDRSPAAGLRETVSGRANRQAHATKRTVSRLAHGLRTRPEETVAAAQDQVANLVTSLFGEQSQRFVLLRGASLARAHNHSINVTLLTLLVARHLHMPQELCIQLGLGAMLHDIGFLELPPGLADRAGPRSRAEQGLYEQHPVSGLRLAQRLRLPPRVAQVILGHHERLDGSGYPSHLQGEAISAGARIVAVCDRFDELINPMAERPPLTPAEALASLFQQGSRYDIRILRALVRSIGRYPPGSLVRLSDGRVALVISLPVGHPGLPCVQAYAPNIPAESAPLEIIKPHADCRIEALLPIDQVARDVLRYLQPSAQVSFYLDSAT